MEGFKLRWNDAGIFVTADDFYILPKPNQENKKIDIEVYCDKLSKSDKQTQLSYTFLILDMCLGESYTETAIGVIEPAHRKKRKMIPLKELYGFLTNTFAENGWTLSENPDDTWTGYQLEPNQTGRPYRDDVLFGYTSHTGLIRDYLQGERGNIDYLRSVGADYVFIAYNHSHIPQEQKVSFRGEIEDALNLFFAENKLGRHIGGATGISNSYIDLIVFDTDEFNRQIDSFLEKFDIKAECVPFSELIP